MAVNLDDVIKLAEQLDPAEQNLLIYRLRVKQMIERGSSETPQPAPPHQYSDEWLKQRGNEFVEMYRSPTREELIRDAEILRNTPARPEDDLLGKYANPNIPEISEEQFHADLHAIATEWEQELDEFDTDES